MFKVGDVVEVLEGRNKGKVRKIIAVDYDWVYPYELEDCDELYGKSEIRLVDLPKEESSVDSELSDVEEYYLIVYNPSNGRTLLFDPSEKLLIDECYGVEPKENPYFMGFFDGLSHSGVKFAIKVQYLT
jgi:signal peptidase I